MKSSENASGRASRKQVSTNFEAPPMIKIVEPTAPSGAADARDPSIVPHQFNSTSVQTNSKTSEPSASLGALYLALNFIAAICCIFVNRRLLKPPVSFKLPITLTLVGYGSSVVGLAACRALGMMKGKRHSYGQSDSKGHGGGGGGTSRVVLVNGFAHYRDGRAAPTSHAFTRLARGAFAWARAQPWFLICTTAGAPLLANYSLLLNSVGVYQLSKVLVTPSILMFERLIAGAPPLSTRRIVCLVFVSLGVAVVTWGDMGLNFAGLAVATFNILVAGYYKVSWSHMCRSQNLTSLDLMERVMPQATMVLACFAAAVEGKDIARYPFQASTWGLLGACGVTAFLTSWSGYVVIANLSALTHQLLGQAKTCIILLAGALFLHSPLTTTQGYGAALAMGSMMAYTKYSMIDQAKERRRKEAKATTTFAGAGTSSREELAGEGLPSTSQLHPEAFLSPRSHAQAAAHGGGGHLALSSSSDAGSPALGRIGVHGGMARRRRAEMEPNPEAVIV